MKVDRRELIATLAPGLLLAIIAAGVVLLLAGTLEPAERAAFTAMLESRGALLLFAWLVLSGAMGALLRSAYRHWVGSAARLAEQAGVLVAAADAAREIEPAGSAETRALAGLFNQLARQRSALRSDVAAQIRQASLGIEQERNRLAALMAELTQSVVVCNLDGRILLYNSRARLQFKALSHAPQQAGGAELIGIGRSIYGVFDRNLVAHALENIRNRMARGAASPSTQFVTATPAGQLLRVQMAPVQTGEASADGAADIGGFVMMLDNVTRSFEEEAIRDRLLHGLSEGSRSSLANMQAAVDMLALPDVEPEMRDRFLGVVREEVAAMSARIAGLAQRAVQGLKARWPLEDMLGSDLVAAAIRQIERCCGRPASVDEVDPALWLRVDSFSLLQALSYLASRLVDEFDVRFLQLRLKAAGERAQLDLIWSGHAMSNETVMSWEREPMRFEAESTPLSVRDVVERHGGEMWFERERVRHQAFFRFLLPVASGQESPEEEMVQSGSRPEYYDFDLFGARPESSELDDRPLSSLAYTVFDTETTGLSPASGDEIIQIGAVRIVNGRLLRHERFEQLVDPGRMIGDASLRIHGITQDMVAGKPRIDQVLPAFHAFAQDTVLVAHNAAFDLKFLQLKEADTGIVFRQPVLDTLLLSALVHPNQRSHELEAIAERFEITLLGRHTALGDALVT
ncbi:3'-5' exonuclease, partial [Aquabacterium sp.]|uniref:3'-5' exonuclease n=1 Tax=Aquabacterium sp. TaxID=1872578 RepID=UPI002BBB7DD3